MVPEMRRCYALRAVHFVGVVGVRHVKGSVWVSEKVMCGSCARHVRVCFVSLFVTATVSQVFQSQSGSVFGISTHLAPNKSMPKFESLKLVH